MSSDFLCTILLDVSGFPASVNRNVIATAITNRFASLKVTAVQFVGNVARLSFADPAAKRLILRNQSIVYWRYSVSCSWWGAIASKSLRVQFSI